MSSPRPEVTDPSAPRTSAGPKAAPDQTPANASSPESGSPGSGAAVFKHGSVLGDRIFRGISTAAGLSVIAVIVLIAVFLLVRAIPSLQANTANFFFSNEFNTTDAEHLAFGIRDLLIVTVLSSAFALVLAVPVSMGIAIFLTQYAPRRLARGFGNLVDLLAAVPSIVFGL